MEVKLNSLDVVQIAKALNCGWLNLSKIDCFKSLLDGYNPPREIGQQELQYYLDRLYKGWGYVPTDGEQIKEMMLQGLEAKQLEKWEDRIGNDSVYRYLIKSAFLGLLAVKALGGKFYDVEPDFSFMDEKAPKF